MASSRPCPAEPADKRTSFVTNIHSRFSDEGISGNVTPLRPTGGEFVEGVSLSASWAQLLPAYLAVIDPLTNWIDDRDERIDTRSEGLEETWLPITIPGVGHHTD